MPLFALQAPSYGETSNWMPIVAIVAIALTSFGVFLWLLIRQVARSRELAHLERMKALELGQPTGPSEAEKGQEKYLHNVFWIGFWMGGAVPIAACSAASAVVLHGHIEETSILRSIWICTAVISVASVVCATVLMVSSRRWRDKGVKGSDKAAS